MLSQVTILFQLLNINVYLATLDYVHIFILYLPLHWVPNHRIRQSHDECKMVCAVKQILVYITERSVT